MDFSFFSRRNLSLFILFSLFFIFNTYIYPFLHPTAVIVPVRVRSAVPSSFHFDANLNKTNEVEVQVHELRSPNECDGAAEAGQAGRKKERRPLGCRPSAGATFPDTQRLWGGGAAAGFSRFSNSFPPIFISISFSL